MMSCFSLTAFEILWLFLGFDNSNIMCFDVDLFVYSPWNSLSFSNVYIYVFPQIWQVLDYYFFKYFFCYFLFHFVLLKLLQCICLYVRWSSIGLSGSFHFSWFYISYCSSDWKILMFVSSRLLFLTSSSSNLLLNHSSKFFTSVIILFSSRIFWLIFIIYFTYILICSDIFLIFLRFFFLAPWTYLTFFTNISNIWDSVGIVSAKNIFSVNGPNFLVSLSIL